ncbi:hypothetical protein cypCar_00045744, partial [Cyprinus carpio]
MNDTMLLAVDEVIGQVLSIMKAQSVPYTAVFTAIWPSGVIDEVSPAVQSVWSQSLLQSRREELTATLVLNYEDVLNYRSFKLIFVMNRRHYKVFARHWFTMDLVHLAYEGKNAMFNGSRYIYAPAEYSYR